ncbi:hypothetical protein HF285_14605 [Acidithiobacillus ferrooxidans F221]|uniref:hypothetical protein n=1 Tax=Acidithiobacillus ferrooxidans TaxID=920 RepID=UPI001C06AE1D|nr:hypothetical protein [Acidithiobacillus ferrooxidans]MBU2809447.1 hypothetical protein [Acidithiobacillus ferrooxidans F221]
MGKKVQSYTAEFRAEAVKLILAQGFSLQGLHSGFQCPRGTSANWVPKPVVGGLQVSLERSGRTGGRE